MLKLIFLPGMDGTGKLFSGFLNALPDRFKTVIVRYPIERYLSYSELVDIVRASCPVDEPFVIVAESFSVPLAIIYAATNPLNLKGLVLCTGFVTSPVKGVLRCLGRLFAPVLFRIGIPKFVIKIWLAGSDAPAALLSAVRNAISSVRPNVMADRIRAILACEARTEMSLIEAPILYIQAKHDRLVKTSCFQEILQVNPQVNLVALEGPHLILQRDPLRSAEVIVQFVMKAGEQSPVSFSSGIP
jgi:pimeloyl-[acyl-carrier protein] methyl ester esterase